MIDVHMIPSPGFERGFAEQVERLAHPLIRVQTGEFVLGDMLEARSRAYALGSAPYVSWVDPDDEVLDTSWIAGAVELMEADPTVAVVYPRWIATRDGKIVSRIPIHVWDPANFNRGSKPVGHTFSIMRRANVAQTFADLKRRTSSFQNRVDILLVHSQMRYGRCVSESTVAYNWKLQPSSGRHCLNTDAVVAIGRQFMAETLRLVSARSSACSPGPGRRAPDQV
jgi:hypothetical protein